MNTTLRKARLKRGKPLVEVARDLDTDAGHLSRMERGDPKHRPGPDLAMRLYEYYGRKVPLEEILCPQPAEEDAPA